MNKLIGADASDYAGMSVAGAGDVNGDGRADMLVGANAEGDGSAGAAYLVLGSVTGSFDHLLRALLNLLDNAIKYAAASGRIAVEGRRSGDTIRIQVSNDGRVIDEALVARVGERFVEVGLPHFEMRKTL